MEALSFDGVRSKRVLIEGDVGSGKTRITRALLLEAASSSGDAVTLIDMAPPRRGGTHSPGGRIMIPRELSDAVRRLNPRCIARPRTEGSDREGVLRLAVANADKIAPCLEAFCRSPTDALFVNDLTIFLHAGNPELLRAAILKSSTFVGNAYSGTRIGGDKGSGIASNESHGLRELEEMMDAVIRL